MPYWIKEAFRENHEPFIKGGSMQGAGGVGGLLKEGEHYPCYDANGNIMQKLDEAGTMVMNVDYDPFGRNLGHSGPAADENPYRFSTKPYDDVSKCYYYGYRFYDPGLGRWLNRDPIGEDGGVNVYAMVWNDPVNLWDVLGKACGAGWTDPIFPDNFIFFDFTAACQAHDTCYATCGADRGSCDANFYNDMSSECNQFRRNLIAKQACLTAASIYYTGVRAGGSGPFKSAQRSTSPRGDGCPCLAEDGVNSTDQDGCPCEY